jgi:hypothetical protein
MATTNQRNRSGSSKGESGKAGIQKATAQAGQKLSDMRDEVSDYMSHGAERLGTLTRGHEGQAVLVALAAGFGIGFVIGCALVSGNQRPKTWSDRLLSEGLGRRLLERVERMVPETLAEHFSR